ncbi:MAG TPA: carbohydrate ABC transporter permease [Chloroflexota bacterium]
MAETARASSAPIARAGRARLPTGPLVINAFLTLGSVLMLMPFIWMILSSFKTQFDILTYPPTFLPREWHPENYITAWNTAPFGRFYTNSLIVAVTTTLSALLFGTMAGFGFSKHRFWGDRFFFVCILTNMMIPIHVALIPRLYIAKELGWVDSLLGLIMPELVTTFGAFLMTQFMQSIPDELIDAARIDGAGEVRIYWQIMLPLVRPALAALAIFRFMWSWNDFLWPVIVINSTGNKTLPIALAFFEEDHRTNYNLLMAAATFIVLPVMLIFFAMQKQFVAGITMTGLKG